MANQTGPGADRTGQRRRRHRRGAEPSSSAPPPIDLLEAVRAASLPVGLGASAFLRSPWWLAAALAYNIAGGPVHDFLATVLGAAADQMAARIRHSPRARPPADPQLMGAQPAPKALASPDPSRTARTRSPADNGGARVRRRRRPKGGDHGAAAQGTGAGRQPPGKDP